MSNIYTELLPRPAPGTINTGMRPCPTQEIQRRYGLPCGNVPLTQFCYPRSLMTKAWKARLVTADLGPFRVTGHHLSCELFGRALIALKERERPLYNILGTAGMLCCRLVRGARKTPSNHAFGMPIDFTIGGLLDQRGDNRVMRGSLIMYSIFKEFGLFWGAGFPTEDGHHWEPCEAVTMDWILRGVF